MLVPIKPNDNSMEAICVAISAFLDQGRLDLALKVFDSIVRPIKYQIGRSIPWFRLIKSCTEEDRLNHAVNIFWAYNSYIETGDVREKRTIRSALENCEKRIVGQLIEKVGTTNDHGLSRLIAFKANIDHHPFSHAFT